MLYRIKYFKIKCEKHFVNCVKFREVHFWKVASRFETAPEYRPTNGANATHRRTSWPSDRLTHVPALMRNRNIFVKGKLIRRFTAHFACNEDLENLDATDGNAAISRKNGANNKWLSNWFFSRDGLRRAISESQSSVMVHECYAWAFNEEIRYGKRRQNVDKSC